MPSRILIIEQHGNLARNVAAILPRGHYRIRVAPAVATSVLRIVATFRPDLVVLAIAAPADCALVRSIRVRSEAPLIVCTPDASDSTATSLLRQGADDCIRLPVHPEELGARIEARLRRACWAGACTYP